MKKQKKRYISIGKKIKEARKNKGWSQRQLAKAIGFETSTAISLIETGERKVTIEDLEKIAEVLHKTIRYFLGEEEKGNLRFALRADKKLTSGDKERILEFIEFIKKRKYGERRD